MSIFKKVFTQPAGALIVVSTGEYSDYSVLGVYRALVAFDEADLAKRYVAAHPGATREDLAYDDDKFVAWIVAQGVLEQIDTAEWHTGDYEIYAVDAAMPRDDE